MKKQAIIRAIQNERVIRGQLKDQSLIILCGRDAGLCRAIEIVKRINNDENGKVDKSN